MRYVNNSDLNIQLTVQWNSTEAKEVRLCVYRGRCGQAGLQILHAFIQFSQVPVVLSVISMRIFLLSQLGEYFGFRKYLSS